MIGAYLSSPGKDASASTIELKPIKQILLEETSLPTASTFILRCFSFFQVTQSWLSNSNNPKATDLSQTYKKLANSALQTWLVTEEMATNKTPNTEFFISQTKIMQKRYVDLMAEGKALAGNVFAHPTVNSDRQICQDFEAQILRILRQSLERMKNAIKE